MKFKHFFGNIAFALASAEGKQKVINVIRGKKTRPNGGVSIINSTVVVKVLRLERDAWLMAKSLRQATIVSPPILLASPRKPLRLRVGNITHP